MILGFSKSVLFFARNEAAISETARKYGGFCNTIAYNILHSREDAEECVNDTYLHAWDAIPPTLPARLSAYLGRITRNLSINRYRSRSTKKRSGEYECALEELVDCVSDNVGVEAELDMKLLTEAINAFLYANPQERRSIFIRRYWYLQPIRKIAEDFGISESKTASLLHRMRGELKAHLEKEGFIP